MVTRGVSVTRKALTLLQLASVLAIDEAITIIDRAVQTERIRVRELRASLGRNSGAHGMRQARALVAAAEDDSESEAERLFVRMLTKHRITGWVQQQWTNGVRMDFVWPELGIVVSVHGWMFHRRYDRWDRDLRTADMLGLVGFLPLSFPWKRLRFEEESVIRELAAAIESRESFD
ncbi:endonuclease domain-containing protein [Gordonia liuliyuniae]|uniref:Endonuclease domain-containing protein n=1 Tax=Gordonia liuliyuniae TaxID=2911517 RepID=A0ABS9IPG7_9ACTN|nr:endonuclease domain-containing protein [Gordonia liuliyuniae]MCF8587461.1 endonuclease domain-containing protein [Gordonia liuliyuniae]